MRKRRRLLKEMRRMGRLGLLLWPYARVYKGLIALGIALTALFIALHLAQPWPLKWIIDLISNKKSASSLLTLFGSPAAATLALSGLYLLLALLAGLAQYGQNLLLAGIGNRILARFRIDLFGHVLKQSLAFHERRDIGELLTRVVYDTARLRQGVRNILTRTFQTVLLFVFKVVVLFWIDVRLAAILALTGGLALVFMRKPSQRIFKAARKQRKSEGRLAGVVGENLVGIREFQTFNPGEISDTRFKKQNAKSLKSEQRVRRLAAALLFRTEVLLAASICLILLIGGRAVQNGRLSTGDLVLFFSYATGLLDPFRNFARQAALSGRTLACADRLIGIMEKEPVIRDLPDAVSAEGVKGDLAFVGVSLKSRHPGGGGRLSILKGVSFELKSGERLAVLGPNGAGKSTLLRLVLRFADPREGRVLLDGREISGYTLATLRGLMSVVFQDSVFFGLSVLENIAMGRRSATPDEVREAAIRTGIAGMIEKLPEGYDTPILRQGGMFSGGEKQKIAISRALLRRGRLWLLDEPTSALDAEAADSLTKVLLEVTAGLTTIWVTHDFRILPHMDRVLHLDKGRVQFEGRPEEFRAWLYRDSPWPADPRSKDYLRNLR